MPQIELANGKVSQCDQQILRNLPIQNPSQALQQNKWTIVYERKHYDQANGVFETLRSASVKIGIQVEQPNWIELSHGQDYSTLDNELKRLIESKMRPTIVFVMLSNEKNYKAIKAVCYSNQLVSQCVKYNNFGRGMQLSVASNILRQMNSKIGGDLYNLKFAQQISPLTMLFGIDVCHSGPNSIVGFCASINKDMSQYWSERIVQRKG